MVADLARMGDLAAHIAKIARMRYPNHAVPASIEPNFKRMAVLASDMVEIAGRTLRERNVLDAEKMADHDEEVDLLRTLQFKNLLDDKWAHGVEAARATTGEPAAVDTGHDSARANQSRNPCASFNARTPGPGRLAIASP